MGFHGWSGSGPSTASASGRPWQYNPTIFLSVSLPHLSPREIESYLPSVIATIRIIIDSSPHLNLHGNPHFYLF